MENIVCTLRNISYKIDLEIDRDIHADAIKVEDKVDAAPTAGSGLKSSPTSGSGRRPADAVGTGCLFMKKKPHQLSRKFRKKAKEEVDAAPPVVEVSRYVLPKRKMSPLGVELVWDPETVNLYVEILKRCNNPVTLEAAAGAIHNLIACQWNVSGITYLLPFTQHPQIGLKAMRLLKASRLSYRPPFKIFLRLPLELAIDLKLSMLEPVNRTAWIGLLGARSIQHCSGPPFRYQYVCIEVLLAAS